MESVQVSSFIEILEPRWAPARLISGLLPPQFGVDLASRSVPLIETGNDGEAASSNDRSYAMHLADGGGAGLKAWVVIGPNREPVTLSLLESSLARLVVSTDRGAIRELTFEDRAFLDTAQSDLRWGRVEGSRPVVVDPVMEFSATTPAEFQGVVGAE